MSFERPQRPIPTYESLTLEQYTALHCYEFDLIILCGTDERLIVLSGSNNRILSLFFHPSTRYGFVALLVSHQLSSNYGMTSS